MNSVDDYDVDSWFDECPEKFKDIADALTRKNDPLSIALRNRFGWEMIEFYNQFLSDRNAAESPIEIKFLEAIYALAPSWGRPIETSAYDLSHMIKTDEPNNAALYIFPQKKIKLTKEYRVDFLIVCKPDCSKPLTKRVVVECDGHDFHEKTKEQAKRDKQRDRDFVSSGYHVFRFTGSEIHNDALKCAEEVIRFCDRRPR